MTNIEKLTMVLNEKGVSSAAYSVSCELRPDTIVLCNEGAQWIVFYFSERGTRHDEKFFVDEKSACDYMEALFS